MGKHITHNVNFSPTLDITPSPLPDINKVISNWTKTLRQRALQTNTTCIVNSGATGIYFATNDTVVNIDRAAPRDVLGKARGQTQQSVGMGNLALPHLPS